MDDLQTLDPGEFEDEPSTTAEGDVIGAYHLVRKIGQGGMGEVWEAEQREPIHRTVAFKVIRQGMVTEQVVARFEAERQVLTVMDHPAVAKVLDAGSTPHGRPFFVMEYVPGVPITEHCDRNRSTVVERLRLFQKVCEGVQHAHQKAIIHRDLKPSNVLVAVQDGEPVPKIIDFGIAKAIGQDMTDETMHTQLGAMIGTPEYMSPEQAELTAQDIDTRSDVYSLGVMLYELLAGKLPFDSRELREEGFDGVRRKIREVDPPTPSAAFDSMATERKAVCSEARRSDPAALQRELRGDLNWITMKALEKDRARRYGLPAELSADIERYLTDKPVVACPPSVGYRAAKFVRRHRWGVAVATLLCMIFLAGSIGTVVGLVRAQNENRKARAVISYLLGILGEANPDNARGREVTVKEALDKATETVDTAFEGQPEIEADVRDMLGIVYHELGHYERAEVHLRSAVTLYEGELGAGDDKTVDVRGRLARTLMDSGQYADAEREMGALLPIYRERGANDEETLTLMHNLASAYMYQKQHAEAEALLVDLVPRRREVHGEEAVEYQASLGNLASVYMETDLRDRARPLFEEILDLRRTHLEPNHPRIFISAFNLADLHFRDGRLEQAEPLMREAAEGFELVRGANHPHTLEALGLLTRILVGLERFDEAEVVGLRNLEQHTARYGADAEKTAGAADLLVQIYDRTGRPDQAARFRRHGRG